MCRDGLRYPGTNSEYNEVRAHERIPQTVLGLHQGGGPDLRRRICHAAHTPAGHRGAQQMGDGRGGHGLLRHGPMPAGDYHGQHLRVHRPAPQGYAGRHSCRHSLRAAVTGYHNGDRSRRRAAQTASSRRPGWRDAPPAACSVVCSAAAAAPRPSTAGGCQRASCARRSCSP